MSLNHDANGARHISAEDSAVFRKGDEDPFEELIRSIRAATHQASPLFNEKPVSGLARPPSLAASRGSTSALTGSSQSRAGRLAQNHLARLDAQTHDADALDTAKWKLQEEVAKLRSLHDRASKELERKSCELSIASTTIAELEVELNRARQTIAQADRHADQRATRFLEANVEVERLGRNLARMSGQLRDEIMARQAAEQAREEDATRLAKLEQTAILLHAKAADCQLLNEQLTGKLSRQIVLQQDLQARLSTVEHERGVLEDCAAAAQQRAVELENRLRSLQRRATALLVDQTVVRAPLSHLGQRAGEAAEHWRPEAEIANLRQERDETVAR